MAAVCRQPPLYGHPTPFIYFSEPPTFDKNIFVNDASTIYVINTKINSSRKVSSSWLEDYNTSFHVFYKQNFYNQHQIEIWTKTTISSLPPPSIDNFPPPFWGPFFGRSNKNSIFPCIQSSGNFTTSGNLCFRVFTNQLIVINKCVSFRTEKKLIKFIVHLVDHIYCIYMYTNKANEQKNSRLKII